MGGLLLRDFAQAVAAFHPKPVALVRAPRSPRPRPSASAEALGLEKLPFRHITQMIYVVVT